MRKNSRRREESGGVVILPASDDQNRGDQALVWETRKIGEAAGYHGTYYMLTDPSRSSGQSRAEGFETLVPLLRHPGTRYTPKSNLRYGATLTAIWGSIAILDLIRSMLLLTAVGRKALWPFLNFASRKTLSTIAMADSCMVKGGGFIHSTNSVTDPYRAFYALFHIFLAQSLGKKVFVMPNSFGPFKGRPFRYIVRKALKNCVVVTARESRSLEALSKIGIKAELHSDLAFGLESEITTRTALDQIRNGSHGKPIVGITVRPYRFPYSSDPHLAYRNYISQMASFAAWLDSRGFVPVFIEHVMGLGTHESDRHAIDEIVSNLESVNYRVVAEPDFNCRQMKFLYGQCDYVAGTRFHSVIFSLGEGIPSLAIAYGGNKGQGIMADAGMSDFAIDIEDIGLEELKRAFSSLIENPRLHEQIKLLQTTTARSRERLAQLVKSA